MPIIDASLAPAATVTIDTVVAIPIGPDGIVGEFVTFRGLPDGRDHFAIRFGGCAAPGVLVRVHSECVTGDLFGSQRCDCGRQLDEALGLLARDGGYLCYLRQEGRGIGLNAKMKAYRLQDGGYDTYQANAALGYGADDRDFGVAAAMLSAMGVADVTLLTNNPVKVGVLRDHGIAVRVRGTGIYPTAHNIGYLTSKRDSGGHCLDLSRPDS